MLKSFLALASSGALLTALTLFFNLNCVSAAWGCSCSKVSAVKANALALQTLVETYGVDWDGRYPQSFEALYTEAQHSSNPYWKELTSPYTYQKGQGGAFLVVQAQDQPKLRPNPQMPQQNHPHTDFLGLRFYHVSAEDFDKPTHIEPLTLRPGMAVYIPVSPSEYVIYGTDQNARWIIEKNEIFVLSNA